jgi:ferritin-like metal-binding protein YciE
MAMNDLKDVYLDQIQDIYSACKQSIDTVTKLGGVAASDELGKALAAGSAGIADGMEKLERICSDHGIDPDGEFCKGMEGLVKEAHAHALDEEFGSDEARDAMIITQYQRMTHYAIAGYGCCVAFANRLDLDGDAALLKECLDQTREGDENMSKIATRNVNPAAA